MVTFFADSMIYDAQKKSFHENTTEILKAIKQDDSQKLSNYTEQGFTIEIDDVIFLKHNDNTQPIEEKVEEKRASVQTNSRIHFDPKKNFQLKESIEKENQLQQVTITYPIALKQKELYDLIRNVSPYFFLITLLVSSVVATGYASYFSRKIDWMNQMIKKMALEEYTEVIDPSEGDELKELERNIQRMYCKLRKTMRELQQEVQVVKNLEDSRRIFMSGIVHELKTPVMNMTLPLREQYLAEQAEPNKLFLKNQLDYLTGMSKLVSELLELSRVGETTDHELVALLPVLLDVIGVYKEMLDDKEQTIILTDEQAVFIDIPTKKSQKLFSNLLSNAIKYAPRKSSIVIEITDAYFRIENEVLEKNVSLSMKEMHKPFVSTDDESGYSSHGLGLYLVQATLQFYGYKYRCSIEKGHFIYQIFLDKR